MALFNLTAPPSRSFTSWDEEGKEGSGGVSVGGHGSFRWVHVSLDFFGRVSAVQWGAVAAFAWAWHHQRKAHLILAAIRSESFNRNADLSSLLSYVQGDIVCPMTLTYPRIVYLFTQKKCHSKHTFAYRNSLQ